MELSLAKEFILDKGNKLFISKDLDKLLELNDDKLPFIYAVMDTPNGEKLTFLDKTYSDEIIIKCEPFLHKDYFLRYYCNKEVVTL